MISDTRYAVTMKTNSIILSIVAIAALASYNIYRSNSETENMSDTMLANVQALAGGEIYFPFYCAGLGYCAIDGVAYEGTKYDW